jgi:hypothetical protein
VGRLARTAGYRPVMAPMADRPDRHGMPVADRPDLIEPVAHIRWRECGHAPEDPTCWVEMTRPAR